MGAQAGRETQADGPTAAGGAKARVTRAVPRFPIRTREAQAIPEARERAVPAATRWPISMALSRAQRGRRRAGTAAGAAETPGVEAGAASAATVSFLAASTSARNPSCGMARPAAAAGRAVAAPAK